MEWLIITWIAALAAAGPTFGGSTAAAGAGTAVNAAVNGARATKHVSKVRRIIDMLKKLIDKIKDYLKRAKDVAKNPIKHAKEAAVRKAKSIKADVKDIADDVKDFKDNPLKTAGERFQKNLVNDNLGTDTADAIRRGEKTAGDVIRDGWKDELKDTAQETAKEKLKEQVNPIAITEEEVRDEQSQRVVRDADGKPETNSQDDWGGTAENVGKIYDKIEDPVSRYNEHGDPGMDSDEINRNLGF